MEVLLKLACYYIREICIKAHSFFTHSTKMHLAEKYESNKGQN